MENVVPNIISVKSKGQIKSCKKSAFEVNKIYDCDMDLGGNKWKEVI
jgi:hypothetical protein